MKHNAQATGLVILKKVIIHHTSLTDALAESKSHAQANFIQALCYGVCRYYFQLDFIAKKLLDKPLKEKDQDIYLLILIGIYQLQFMHIAHHAAVNETVNVTIMIKKAWAKQLVNAILRRFQREKEDLLQEIQNNETAYYAHPDWIIHLIKTSWSEQYKTILEANNQQAPLVLRVNTQKISRENYLKKIPDAKAHDIATDAIILNEACDVKTLPGFLEGEISVQDAAAQLCASLLKLEPHQIILDACAAPGGKTSHILEKCPTAKLTAIDISSSRITHIHENLKRLHLSATVKCADILDVNAWWNGEYFDRILLDAPCSAMGVIRRHPDIKLLRREDDIKNLSTHQLLMLKTLWPLLKPNGLLLYSTCSILPAENTQVISTFLKSEPSAKENLIEENWGIKQTHGRQILPGDHGMDGFYYCLLSHTL